MRQYDEVAKLISQDLDLATINILTDVPVDDIAQIAANVELESNMQALGFERYMARQETLQNSGQVMEKDATLKKIKMMLKPLAKAIDEFKTNYKSRKPHIAVEVFKRHDSYTLALQTMRTCIMAETTGKNELAALCVRLTESIEKGLDTMQAYRVGVKLITLMCGCSDACFQLKTIRDGKKTTHILEATEGFYEWEEEQEELMAEMAVMFRPMVVPPRPWTALDHGGYWDKEMQQPFIRNAPRATNRTHGITAIPDVYKSVNQIQATPFTVNNFVLDCAEELAFDDELFFKKWFMEIPKRPHTALTKDLRVTIDECNEALGITPESREEHGKGFGDWVRTMLAGIGIETETFKIKQRLEQARFQMVQYINWRKELTSVKSKNRVIKTTLETASAYRNFSRIYFPANLDWRMRVYPMCAGLTTQGVCLQKAMIKFAEGKPIGTQEALDWLKVHTANCFGMDKSSWQDRLDWTDANQDLIQRVANDPCDTVDEWMNTDDPWLFIAACEQMGKYYQHGLDAVVDIPIPMDGTCNGAQHYAAMTRDQHSAYGVNVAPNGTQDLQERLNKLRGEIGQVSDLTIWQRLSQKANHAFKALIGA